jgi:glyoxylase-like metal-dependent hydrolase (beta-lactamase superfamily II)
LPQVFGDYEITRIGETLGPGFATKMLLPDFDAGAITRHPSCFTPEHYNAELGRLVLSVHAWLIRRGADVILVDTCGGNDKERPEMPGFHRQNRPFLDNLAAAGVAPPDVTMVINTHLHVDHVGWNTRLVDGGWVPTFPNATYVMPRADREHFDPATASDVSHADARVFTDSVQPVLERSEVFIVDGPQSVADGIAVEPAPGHSPGHMVVVLSNGDQEAICTGDVFHHIIQVHETAWSSGFCWDPVMARESRRRLLFRAAERNSLLLPGHCGVPHMGRVHASDETHGFVFVPGAA